MWRRTATKYFDVSPKRKSDRTVRCPFYGPQSLTLASFGVGGGRPPTFTKVRARLLWLGPGASPARNVGSECPGPTPPTSGAL